MATKPVLRLAGLILAALALSGCAHNRSHAPRSTVSPPPGTSVPPPPTAATATPPPAQGWDTRGTSRTATRAAPAASTATPTAPPAPQPASANYSTAAPTAPLPAPAGAGSPPAFGNAGAFPPDGRTPPVAGRTTTQFSMPGSGEEIGRSGSGGGTPPPAGPSVPLTGPAPGPVQ